MIDKAIKALLSPKYTWSQFWRRAYVLTFPLSPLIQLLAIIVMMTLGVVEGCYEFHKNILGCIWRGERNIWGD